MNNRGFAPIAIILIVLGVAAVGVVGYVVMKRQTTSPPSPILGGDRDVHGCIGSAGYLWCDTKNKCLRPWEEKCEAANTSTSKVLSEAEARVIAEKSCIKGDEALGEGIYNENSKTWWYNANLNATKPGCNPACVVSEETKTAEINWRCTGLNNPQCGIENCHGLDISCGPNIAQMCTMMYQLGDRCRQYASCGIENGSCKQIVNPKFTACKNCAQKCEVDYKNDPSKALECESKCK